MIDFQAIGLPIITAVIGSGLILSGINSFYNEFYNKPHVIIDVIPNDIDKHLALIKIVNDGRVPATKLSLMIHAPESVSDYNIFTSENSTKVKFDKSNSKFLLLHTPRLAHGDGSMIRIDLRTDGNPENNYRNYVAYATYDQGSSKAIALRQFTLEEDLFNFLTRGGLTLTLIIGGLTAAVLAFVIAWRRIKRRKDSFYTLMQRIDTAYDQSTENKNGSLINLGNLRNNIITQFEEGTLSETHYNILNTKISDYREKVQSQK